MRPGWLPDWTGKTCVIVASGPSAADQPLHKARDRAQFIAVNNSWRLCPWAGILYAADVGWWSAHDGATEFRGLRVTGEPKAAAEFDLYHIRCDRVDVLLTHGDRIGWGGNSGFGAINLAAICGVSKIVLVGFDMHLENGSHWHGDHGAGLNNPNAGKVNRWRRAIDDAAGTLKAIGVEVINSSPSSSLKAYPKAPFLDAAR